MNTFKTTHNTIVCAACYDIQFKEFMLRKVENGEGL